MPPRTSFGRVSLVDGNNCNTCSIRYGCLASSYVGFVASFASFDWLHGAVYDVTRPDTFDNLSKWLEEVETYHPGRGREVN